MEKPFANQPADAALEQIKSSVAHLPSESQGRSLLHYAGILIEAAGYEMARAKGPHTATRFILMANDITKFLHGEVVDR